MHGQRLLAETIAIDRKSDTVCPLADLFDRVHFLMLLGTPRYHTFVLISAGYVQKEMSFQDFSEQVSAGGDHGRCCRPTAAARV